MDLVEHRLDLDSEVNGVWTPADSDGTQFLVARWQNPNHSKLNTERMLKENVLGRANDIRSDEIRQISAEVLAETILLGWKNFKDKGIEIPYSKGKAIELLADPALDNFKEMIIRFSQNQAAYRADRVRADEKKLKL